ncbi:hypothetical protein [Deinococcus reticulitermitis]|nr:hypothetical protein [Deinococcus reticulitermitis]
MTEPAPPSSSPTFRRARGMLWAALIVPALLAGCQRPAQEAADGLTTKILFTANGSYDAQADRRGRERGTVGLRRVEWRSRPPLEAQAVTVEYDGDQRPRAWSLTAEGASFSAVNVAGEAGMSVQTAQGAATLVREGQLAGVLVLTPAPGKLHLLTRGYAVQYAQDLLPAFGASAR